MLENSTVTISWSNFTSPKDYRKSFIQANKPSIISVRKWLLSCSANETRNVVFGYHRTESINAKSPKRTLEGRIIVRLKELSALERFHSVIID